jgi:Family of unknown function (DUF6282)
MGKEQSVRIENAIDLHVHFGPDGVGGPPRPGHHGVTAPQAVREAREAGYRAIVLKSHSFASPQIAAALSEGEPGLAVYGGICTDHPSGGLNVDAVELALRMGAKIVWLPTVHSHQDWLNGKAEMLGIRGDGIHVTDHEGRVIDAVHEIFSLVRQHDAVLATGHTTMAEHSAVVRAFAREGKVLVTHAGERLAGPKLTASQAAELAEMGAMIELTAQCCIPLWGHAPKPPEEMIAMIRQIGPEHCTLSSDYGWTTEVPHPAAGHHDFLETLWAAGMSEELLKRMAVNNPARLLGLTN